jgi:hypothetical protein
MLNTVGEKCGQDNRVESVLFSSKESFDIKHISVIFAQFRADLQVHLALAVDDRLFLLGS